MTRMMITGSKNDSVHENEDDDRCDNGVNGANADSDTGGDVSENDGADYSISVDDDMMTML